MQVKPKICIPIIKRSKDEILNTALELIKEPVEMVEWRIDFFESIENIEEVKAVASQLREILKAKQLIITFRTEAEGGENISKYVSYVDTVHDLILETEADYVDVEAFHEGAAELLSLAKERTIRVIASYHDFRTTPEKDEMIRRLVQMKAMGADVGKIAVMPRGKADVETLLNATSAMKEKEPGFPIVTMSMGELGRVSRLYGGLYGSEITFGCAGEVSAPGQIPVDYLRKTIDCIFSGKKHIVLIGFMGTGKSTISAELSSQTGQKEVDTDAMIVEMQGREIAEIFQMEGEEYFRELETDLIDRLGKLEPCIISCGGGMVMRDLNVRKLQAIGTVVLLTAKPETVYERVKDSTKRPVLNGNMNIPYIRKLMEKRKLYYNRAAEVVVSTDCKEKEQIAKEIRKKIVEKYAHIV